MYPNFVASKQAKSSIGLCMRIVVEVKEEFKTTEPTEPRPVWA